MLGIVFGHVLEIPNSSAYVDIPAPFVSSVFQPSAKAFAGLYFSYMGFLGQWVDLSNKWANLTKCWPILLRCWANLVKLMGYFLLGFLVRIFWLGCFLSCAYPHVWA